EEGERRQAVAETEGRMERGGRNEALRRALLGLILSSDKVDWFKEPRLWNLVAELQRGGRVTR
ncbi:hypothetical protein TeGR_g10580, partial [Tetraparma gracilis]